MKRKLLSIIPWIATIAWLSLCLYLSWQTGEETTEFSQRIAQFLLDLLGRLGLQPDAQQFHAGLRLFAHFGVFFVTGLLTAGAFSISLPWDLGRTAFWVAAISCTLVAVLAEVGKLAVPGRHLTWRETGLNVVGAVCGAGLIRVVCAFVYGKKTR